jgi:hypothetical protein
MGKFLGKTVSSIFVHLPPTFSSVERLFVAATDRKTSDLAFTKSCCCPCRAVCSNREEAGEKKRSWSKAAAATAEAAAASVAAADGEGEEAAVATSSCRGAVAAVEVAAAVAEVKATLWTRRLWRLPLRIF